MYVNRNVAYTYEQFQVLLLTTLLLGLSKVSEQPYSRTPLLASPLLA